MHLYHILINWSQKFWVVYVQYRFIYEQCEFSVKVLNFRKENNLFIFPFRFSEFGVATSSQVYEMIFGEMQFF